MGCSAKCSTKTFCITMGVFLLFDRTLLALGNLAFLLGLGFLLGPAKAFKFFFRKEKWKGSAALFVSFGMIPYGFSFFGFLIELYGIWKLFAAFLPNVITSLKTFVPGAATVLNMWPFSMLTSYIYDSRRLPV